MDTIQVGRRDKGGLILKQKFDNSLKVLNTGQMGFDQTEIPQSTLRKGRVYEIDDIYPEGYNVHFQDVHRNQTKMTATKKLSSQH